MNKQTPQSPISILHPPSSIPLAPLAALLAFPLILLWRSLFAGQAFFWGTPLLQFIPWQRMAAAMWRAGHLPLWNPLAGCGAPLAANYQAAAFYPPNLLHLLLPSEVALSWLTALHLALAGWGMYGWGRAVGLDRFPAFIGALALSGSGFLVGRAALFPSMAFTFPWLAVWLWRAEVLVQRRRPGDVLWLGLALGLGLLAGHAQTAFYGGLLLAAYTVFLTVQEARGKRQEAGSKKQEAGGSNQETKPSKLGVWNLKLGICHLPFVICSFIIGLCLAAVQLLPTAELMLQSQRSAGVGYEFATTYSLWPWRLITFAAPDFFGNPGRGDYWGYATYWEDAGYVGVLPLLLALGAVLSRKQGDKHARTGLVRFWAACAAVTIVLALGKNTPVFPFLFRYVPTFDLFQAPARWLAVTTVALAALAALGAQRWPAGHRGRRQGALGIALGMALLIGGLAAPRLVPGIRSTFGTATARLGGTLAVAGALMLLRRDVPWWRVAVGAFIALDLLLFGWPLIPTVDRSLYYDDTAAAAFLRSEPSPARVYWPTDPTHREREYDAEQRVKFTYLTFEDFGPRAVDHWWDMRETLVPNAGMLDGVASANNFDPLLVGRYVDILEAAVETPAMVQALGVTHVVSDRPWPESEPVGDPSIEAAALYRLPQAPGRAWVVPSARYVPPDQMLAALADPTFDPTAEVLLEPPPRSANGEPGIANHASRITPQVSRFTFHVSRFTPHASRITLQYPPNRVTIRATLDAPGYLVLADTWYPGWQATVDGVPAEILRANYNFRAVWLEAGEHEVNMVYRPTLVLVGAAVSLTTMALLVVGLLLARTRVGQR
jgi:hypothetical protein